MPRAPLAVRGSIIVRGMEFFFPRGRTVLAVAKGSTHGDRTMWSLLYHRVAPVVPVVRSATVGGRSVLAGAWRRWMAAKVTSEQHAEYIARRRAAGVKQYVPIGRTRVATDGDVGANSAAHPIERAPGRSCSPVRSCGTRTTRS